jgi:hypothetical protein
MATSPLFGWEEPDDTDLVKDGAAAIRTLGNAIDTSMGDLLGGTTGQVLSKNSNTNMDFTWVTSDDANAIQNTIVDAKGDLIAASAADTPARLAVGTNGQVLTADSTAATGLAWATSSAGGMTLLSTTTLSGATTTTASIPSGYIQLYIAIESPQNATADGILRIAPNGSTTTSLAINIAYNNNVASGPTVSSGYINTGVSLARTSTLTSLILTIDNYTNSAITSPYLFYGYIRETTPKSYVNFQAGAIDLGAAITSLTFSNSGGNFTGGTIKLYGVK